MRVGLGYVNGVRAEEMEALVAERERGGPYERLADLASRSGAGREALEKLAWAGALEGIGVGAADAGEAASDGRRGGARATLAGRRGQGRARRRAALPPPPGARRRRRCAS